jgi:hypothetical protein
METLDMCSAYDVEAGPDYHQGWLPPRRQVLDQENIKDDSSWRGSVTPP